ncbi:MAG: glycosyltransferase family 9 protein [Syntrophobacterales bacterium]|nr:glycosyltransferase family 9 protein [Syntrophobacterales bacterium]
MAKTHLWRKKYDLALIPRFDTDYYHATILAYMSGARWRLGFTEKATHTKRVLNRGYDRLLTHVCHNISSRHEVEHSLELLRYLGFAIQEDHLELWPAAEDRDRARALIHHISLECGDGPRLALSPGAGHPRRQWPGTGFAEVARWWIEAFHGVVVIIGGPGDEKTGEAIAQRVGRKVVNMAGKTTLRQTGEILRRCHLFVGNDSGPMHLAAAAKTPVVEISLFPLKGPLNHAYSPARFHPWKVPYKVVTIDELIHPCRMVCTASQAHCIKQIKTDDVIQAILSLHHEIDLLAYKSRQ